MYQVSFKVKQVQVLGCNSPQKRVFWGQNLRKQLSNSESAYALVFILNKGL